MFISSKQCTNMCTSLDLWWENVVYICIDSEAIVQLEKKKCRNEYSIMLFHCTFYGF